MNKPNLLEDAKSISLVTLRVRQPIGEFYIGAISHTDLIDICDFDIRRLLRKDHFEDFSGIQREIDQKRVKEIRQYVETVDATFPTAIILSVQEQSAVVESLSKLKIGGKEGASDLALLTLSNTPSKDEDERILYHQIATVIDGQHRIEALRGLEKKAFYINVAIFIGLDKASEAEVFSTVNLAQTKVNKSLVYDLFAYSEKRSPEKSCHEIAVVLDSEEKSPFYKSIKRLGVATDGRFGETLSQATFVRSLIKHITRDALGDRDIGKRTGKWPKVTQEEFNRFVLRPFFVDNQDEKIADVIWNYFDAVRERWPEAWSSTGGGLILNKTTGYQALMRFFKDVYLNITKEPQVIGKDAFLKRFKKSSLEDDDFNTEMFVPGSSGEGKLYHLLKDECLS